MGNAHFESTITLKNQKVLFEGVSRDNPTRPVDFDYVPPAGDGQGYKGLELLTTTWGGCVSTAIVFLLRKMGKSIDSYQMDVQGYRREQPLSLERIEAHVTIASKDIQDTDMQAAIAKAREISPVWRSLNENIGVEITYKINPKL